jgi:hypothetical protein
MAVIRTDIRLLRPIGKLEQQEQQHRHWYYQVLVPVPGIVRTQHRYIGPSPTGPLIDKWVCIHDTISGGLARTNPSMSHALGLAYNVSSGRRHQWFDIYDIFKYMVINHNLLTKIDEQRSTKLVPIKLTAGKTPHHYKISQVVKLACFSLFLKQI